MAKSPKKKKMPDWYLEQMQRDREFRELLEQRRARDAARRAQQQRPGTP